MMSNKIFPLPYKYPFDHHFSTHTGLHNAHIRNRFNACACVVYTSCENNEMVHLLFMIFSVPFRSEFTFYRSIKYSSHAERTTIQTNSRKKGKNIWNKWQLRQAKCWNSVYGYVHLIKWIDVSEMIEKLDLLFSTFGCSWCSCIACMHGIKQNSFELSVTVARERESVCEKKNRQNSTMKPPKAQKHL